MDRYLFLRHFYRYEKARDVRMVFLSYVSTWSYVGIQRIPGGPNGFRFSFMCIFNLIPGFFLARFDAVGMAQSIMDLDLVLCVYST